MLNPEYTEVWHCEVCGNEAPDYEPEYCCSGYECGCGGQPAEPCFCSDQCAEEQERINALEGLVRMEISSLRRIRMKRIKKEFDEEQARCLAMDSLPDSFTQWPLHIKSALGDINVVKYKMIDKGNEGVWLFGDCPNTADHTYYGYTNRSMDGFAGRHITFKLVDGGSVTLKGPFKTSPPKGVEANYLTRGIIAKRTSKHPDLQDYFGHLTTYHELVHLDRDWVLGDFHRVKNLAQSLANKYNQRLYYRRESQGGAESFYFDPIMKEG